MLVLQRKKNRQGDLPVQRGFDCRLRDLATSKAPTHHRVEDGALADLPLVRSTAKESDMQTAAAAALCLHSCPSTP
jgi:hypothetical protein